MKKRIISCLTVITLIFCAFGLSAEAVGDVIDFARDSIELYPDQSYQLTMKGTPTIVSYYSSDPDIVSVSSSGMVKASATGSSLITAYDEDGNQATCTVNVHEGTSPQSVIPETQSISLTEGASYILKAAVEPADVEDTRLYYSSSDETVAKVDKSGNIKAVKAGVAVITVESASSAVSAGCIVRVTSKSGRNLSVSVNGTLYSIAGEKKANMIVEIANGDESFDCTTNTDGQFYFDDIIQGSYTLLVYKTEQDRSPVATGQLSVGSQDMNMSCVINEKELIVLYQTQKKASGTVQDITLEKTTLSLEQGESFDMSFKVRPSTAALPALKNSSDNDKVAVADVDGRITALSEGTATISFTTADGKITRSCKVTVVAPTRSTYSWIIIAVEFAVLILIVIIFAVSYHRFSRKKERDEGISDTDTPKTKKAADNRKGVE